MIAAARPEFVPLHGAKLDAGWVLEVCLDGKIWSECVLKTEQRISDDRYNELLNGALSRVREEHEGMFTRIQEAVQRVGVDQVRKDVVTKQPVAPSELPPVVLPATKQEVEERSAEATSPRPKHGRSPSLKASKRDQASPTAPKSKAQADWSGTLDVAELMRQIEQEMEREVGAWRRLTFRHSLKPLLRCHVPSH